MLRKLGQRLSMAFLAGAMLMVVAVLSAPSAQAKDVAVNVGDNFFDPVTVTVAVGDKVTWTNTGNRMHDVTADGGAFESPRRMPNGAAYSYTASTPGTFPYICTIHPVAMKATLIVQGAQAALPRTGGGGMATDPMADVALIGMGLAMLAGLAALTVLRRSGA